LNRRAVTFTPQARNDLLSIGDWVAERAGVEVALSYTAHLEAYCNGFEFAGERGRRRDDLRPACVLSDSSDGSQSCLPFQTTK